MHLLTGLYADTTPLSPGVVGRGGAGAGGGGGGGEIQQWEEAVRVGEVGGALGFSECKLFSGNKLEGDSILV